METLHQRIRKGNELIAVFMGAKPSIIFTSTVIVTFPRLSIFPGKQYKVSHLKYYSNWSWLMPVLEKICHLKIGDGKTYVEYACPRTFGMIDSETGEMMIRLDGHPLHKDQYLIRATWEAIVEFITYYNESKN